MNKEVYKQEERKQADQKEGRKEIKEERKRKEAFPKVLNLIPRRNMVAHNHL